MGKLLLIFMSFLTFIAATVTTGCMSGGFKWTRRYAQFVNSTHIVVRVVLYILTLPVYAITYLVDAVIFNTMDFWNGRVSAGRYEFKTDQHTYVVHHGFGDPARTLRHSKIEIWGKGVLLETTDINENSEGEILVTKNNISTLKVTQLSTLPLIQFYSIDGSHITKTEMFIDKSSIAKN